MNKATRFLTMTGMGLLAGVTFGMGPAQAADAAPSTEKAATQSTQVKKHWDRDRDRVVGYYRSLRACELAGRIGERFGRWDDYDCDFQRRGFHRGTFALEVERDWRGGWNRPGHHGHGGRHR